MEQSVVCILAIGDLLRHCPSLLVWRAARFLHGNHHHGILRLSDGALSLLRWLRQLNILQSTTFGAMQAGNIFSFVPDISSARGAGAAIVKLIDSTPEIDAESTAGKTFERENVRGQIRFENVHFRYPTRPGVRVLRDLSFKVEPGTYVALVGASGCGKSTV